MPQNHSPMASTSPAKYTPEEIESALRIGEQFGLPQNPNLQWAAAWILLNAAFGCVCYLTLKLWHENHYILATILLLAPIYIPFARSIAVTMVRSKRQLSTSLLGFLRMTMQSFAFIYIAALCYLTFFHLSTLIEFFRSLPRSVEYRHARNLAELFYDVGYYSTVICMTMAMARVAYFRWIRDTTIAYPMRKTSHSKILSPTVVIELPADAPIAAQPMEDFAGR